MENPNDLRFLCHSGQVPNARDGALHRGFGSIVCDHDQGDRATFCFRSTVLDNGFYANILTGKERCNLCQNPGFVVNSKPAIAASLNIADGNEVCLG